ncbi:MAG: class I SAM-dependent methyltransferase [candidate division Zixibacteria bacterium]|nr:class I SAM-dependent methyltransferase [candidate division Zixibacteria bacterium]
MQNDQTIEYYKKRAMEYDKIYFRDDPVRQGELTYLYNLSKRILNDRNVLDIACGTGFWTRILSETASSIIGVDINEATLEVARNKKYDCPTDYRTGDVLSLNNLPENLDGLLATFVISHVKREDLASLREKIKKTLKPGCPAFFCDNNLICELKPELIPDPKSVNTYKVRELENGDEYTILKNYFEPDELREIFSSWGKINDFYFEKYYWAVSLSLE